MSTRSETRTASATPPAIERGAEGDTLRLSYQGWSGCIVRAPRGSSAAPLVFDPSPGYELDRTAATLLLTHGHPEHVNGALAHLRRAERAPVTVIASRHLCRYLERRTARRDDRFVPVASGARVEANGWSVRVFEWEHMSLFPPGLGPATRYLLTLMKHPRGLLDIVRGGATGPRHGPFLGYSVRAAGTTGSLVYYGEGMHRRTSRQELREALGGERVETLVFGVEPEDAHVLPAILAGHPIARALAFEPHRPWRAEFGLPQIDLPDLVARLRGVGVDAGALATGETVELGAQAS